MDGGAFSRAALRLSVAQPVLSRQIKALEEELGAELYYRTGRGIVLTEAGRILEQHARGVLETTAGSEALSTALDAADAEKAGVLRGSFRGSTPHGFGSTSRRTIQSSMPGFAAG